MLQSGKLFMILVMNIGFTTVCVHCIGNNTTVTIRDVQEDFQTALNNSESWLGSTLLFRYPELLQLTLDIVNQNNTNTSNLTEYELCQMVKNSLKSSQDSCKKPYSSRRVKRKCKQTDTKTQATTLKPSLNDICQQFVTTAQVTTATAPVTAVPVTAAYESATADETTPPRFYRMRRVAEYDLIFDTPLKPPIPSQVPPGNNTLSNDTATERPSIGTTLQPTDNETVTNDPSSKIPTTSFPRTSAPPMPETPFATFPAPTNLITGIEPTVNQGTGGTATNYFFIAVKVIAKTVIISNERKCKSQNGVYSSEDNSCRIPVMNKMQFFNTSNSSNASSYNNNTKYKVIVFPIKNSNSDALKIINIVGNTCSVIALVVLIVTYHIFKSRFSLPDKNIISLSSSLFLSHTLQLLIIFFSYNQTLCKTTGILLHWALLLAFFWMAVMSYDFFITFTKMRPVSADASNARFKKYIISVVSTATIIVLVCILIGTPDGDISGYGYNGRCFVGKFWANLFAFAVPVSFILLTNIVLLISTIFKLRELREASKKVLSAPGSHSSRKKRILLSVLTLKLSVLFGLGWLLGYLDGLVSSQVLTYCYNVIVCLQGTFVFLAFGCHKNLLSRIRGSRSSTSRFQLSSSATNDSRSKVCSTLV